MCYPQTPQLKLSKSNAISLPRGDTPPPYEAATTNESTVYLSPIWGTNGFTGNCKKQPMIYLLHTMAEGLLAEVCVTPKILLYHQNKPHSSKDDGFLTATCGLYIRHLQKSGGCN